MERGKYRGPKENSPSSSGHARAGRSRPRSGGGQLAGRPAARGGARPHLLGAEEGPHGAGSLARTRPAATRAAARFGAQEPAGRTAQGGSVMGPSTRGRLVGRWQRLHALRHASAGRGRVVSWALGRNERQRRERTSRWRRLGDGAWAS
jgi:hypothetical protein